MLQPLIPSHILASLELLNFQLDRTQGNPRIAGLLNTSVLSGGKRLRPILTFMASDLFGLDLEKAAAYAKAIEMIHAASLAHDDVIDGALTRRDQPSINVASSNKKAVLAGDYLLSQVLVEVCSYGRPIILQEIAGAIGHLAEGEWLQIENQAKHDLCLDDVERVALRKTGSLMRLCMSIPAMLANLDMESIAIAKKIGEKIGVAFQFSDDILDFRREGDCRHQDIKNGVINAVIFEALALQKQAKVLNAEEVKLVAKDPAAIESAIANIKAKVLQIFSEVKEDIKNLHMLNEKSASHLEARERFCELLTFLEDRI